MGADTFWHGLSGFIHAVPGSDIALNFLNSMPGTHNLVAPLIECLKNSSEDDDAAKDKAKKFFSMQWLHNIMPWVAIGVGVITEAWALYEYGPVPEALLSGPIVAAVLYVVVDGIGCMLEGKPFLFCVVGNALQFGQTMMKEVLGFNANTLSAPIAKIEVKMLNAMGCKVAGADIIDK